MGDKSISVHFGRNAMNKHRWLCSSVIAASSLLFFSEAVFAVECNKDIMKAHKPFGPVGPAAQVVEKFKNYQLGVPFVVSPGEPLIRRQVSRQDKSYQFAQDVVYKPSWVLSSTYRFKAGVSMPAGQVRTAMGSLDFVSFSDNSSVSFVFINDKGQLCDKVSVFYKNNGNSTLVAGTYTANPDIPATSAAAPVDSAGIGDVIILNSFDGVGLAVSSRKSVDGQLRAAQQTTFDASVGEVSIEGYRIKIGAAGSQKISATVLSEPDATSVWNSGFPQASR